ncbi:Clp protease N-terminal domain-containing protein [Micromonospora parva]|uniref:Clp protease N-terminal domain-containing protein n=1 Tax=Micromonospora parva TaxID=1464048 RepID=UPI0033C9CEF3
MTVLSYLVRWLPLPLLAAVCVHDLGWWRAGVLLLIYVCLPQHWIVGLLATAAALFWLDVSYRYLVVAVICRLAWDLGFKIVFARLIRARKWRNPPTLLAPRLRCGHGLGKRVGDAERMAGIGLAGAATDAYLSIIADHPAGSSCDRTLLLRTAEAARSAGDHTLAAELCTAAVRGVPRDPTGREAVIAVRAHAIRAAACAGLGDLDEAARSLREAQRITQPSRVTERYVQWTAAEVRLAGRRVRTWDELSAELGGALYEQKLTLREPFRFHRLVISLGWRLLEAGDDQGAWRAFYLVGEELEITPAVSWSWVEKPDGTVQVPAKHSQAWRTFTLALAGEVAAMLVRDEALSADYSAAADAATNLAWYLDENLTGARMLLARAQFDLRHGEAAEAAERIRWARRFADLDLHTFTDQRRQVAWVRLRRQLAEASKSASGVEEPPVTSPWPVTTAERELAEAARDRAEELFDRLVAIYPETFGPARRRLAPRLDIELATEPEAEPEAEPETGPEPEIVDATLATPGDPPTAKASPPTAEADPPWMELLMATAGDRCWTLLLALDQARDLGHGHVGPEHLVLALARDGDCAEILAGLDVAADDLRALVASWYHRAETTAQALDPHLTALVRDAVTIAGGLGATRVSAAHLLMAVVANQRNAGAAVLRAGGADLDEIRVRADATFAGPVQQRRAGPLFTAGEIVHQHRLTLPAWLAIGHGLDNAIAEPGRVLGVEHLAAGADAYTGRLLPAAGSGNRGTVRVSRQARAALTGARLGADSAGEWGIDLEHLRRALRSEAPAGPAGGPSTRAACKRAARRGERFVTPEDIREASTFEEHDPVPVPVLTPAARRAHERDRSRSS